MCLTEEDLCVLMSSVLLYLHVFLGRGGKEGQPGLDKGPNRGQLTLRGQQGRAEVCSYIQRATIKVGCPTLNTCKYHICKYY
jgi:hypothetical protein